MAVDSTGNVLSSTSPTGGGAAWSAQRVDSEGLLAVSCCGGLLRGRRQRGRRARKRGSRLPGGNVELDADRRRTPNGRSPAPRRDCASRWMATAQALASDDPAHGHPAVERDRAPSSQRAQRRVSCLSGGFCMAVDTDRALGWLRGCPGARRSRRSARRKSRDTSATLAGVVNPNDAVLGACIVRIRHAACPTRSRSPARCCRRATGGSAERLARSSSGLAANTTYHYRARSPLARLGAARAPTTRSRRPSPHGWPLVHPTPVDQRHARRWADG